MSVSLALFVLREVVLAILMASYLYKILVMQRNTRQWNGLGRALRAECAVYILLWGWFLLLPFVSLLHSRILVVGIELALAAITLHVGRLLPHTRVVHDRPAPPPDGLP